MQDDVFPAAEKILSDIENVVKKDPSLKSFEIIPAEDNENKSPVFHQEESLGLASWCVQPLYCYAYRRLLDLRQNKHRREEPSTVAKWLLGALLLNPDVTTFWNMRRELVRSHKLDPSQELSFARLVLYHKPKCFEAFAYRRWLLPYILDAKGPSYDPVPAESPLCAEIELAGTCADRYANNYHAWSHRRHVVTLRESRGYLHPTLESEWRSSLAWSQRHVSDHSGLAFRQFLLRKFVFEKQACRGDASEHRRHRDAVFAYVSSVINSCNESQKLRRVSEADGGQADEQSCFRALSYWVEECEANENAIRMYSDHEALWYQRRFLAHLLSCLVACYSKYSCYKDDVCPNSRPLMLNDECDVTGDDVAMAHGLLVKAFVVRTCEIVELARKRDLHERALVEAFVRFLDGIGFQI